MTDRVVGKPVQMDLAGLYFARERDGLPLMVQLGDVIHLPLFHDEAALGLFMFEVLGPGVIFSDRVPDTDDFLRSVPPEVSVVIHPHRGDDGKWRFHKVLRD